MKRCPYCDERIQDDAITCRFCGEWLPEGGNADADSVNEPGKDNEIGGIDYRKVQEFKAKYEAMTVSELLALKESSALTDYTPEARQALEEALSRRNGEISLEEAVLNEVEPAPKTKRAFTRGDTYIGLTMIGMALIWVAYIRRLFPREARSIFESRDPAETLIIISILLASSIGFFIAVGLLKRKKMAWTFNNILLIMALIGAVMSLVLGRGALRERFVSRGALICWACGWLIYFSSRKRLFNR